MFRYVALSWDHTSEQQPALIQQVIPRLFHPSTGYALVHQSRGIIVACADIDNHGMRATPLDSQRGIVLGSVYSKHADIRNDEAMLPAQFDAHASRAILNSRGQALLDRYWGHYVAVLWQEMSVLFITPPSGHLPCLVQTMDGVVLAYSCVSDSIRILGRKIRRTHAYTRARVLGEMFDSSSPLDSVHRMLRGEALHVHFHPSIHIERRILWHPAQFQANNECVENASEASKAIRSCVRAATKTLAREHGAVVLRLSGGLDSSIIAGCLRDTGASIYAHTYISKNTVSDTRPWARSVARFCGYPLLENVVDASELNIDRLLSLTPSPDTLPLVEYLFRVELERTLCSIHSASAIFTGDGGDSGFCRDSIALSVLEHLQRHGLGVRMLSIARDVAVVTQRSVWTVLKRSALYYLRGQRVTDQTALVTSANRLAHPDLRSDIQAPTLHPWMHLNGEVRWDTLYRVGALIVPPYPYDLSASADAATPLLAQPLYAQPVVELLLRIPIYMHFHGGRDRGLARQAFYADAPRANLDRVWKDRAPGFLQALLHHHRERLREIFLDGILVRDGFLDRNGVEQAFSIRAPKTQISPTEILRHLDTEMWARAWDTYP